ncbi:glycoside hydrolase [Jaminaea rosea]|uniref:Glycoside hydrolase n=1 Tax=Jaminaea rosea TaxID=1569628 RepID=A0A316V222_9BASI|nr:glycoside hydrolase [Jaminaea rosea]PWN30233.1 glycoside hydrolase [Jaminaea rosea]
MTNANSPVLTRGPKRWWQDAIIYQVWPASFQDSNGDGMGDIPGIISRLDYIKSTGANTIWLSPMYDSPQIDMGYDIADYNAIYPPYGTMADMDALIKGCHERGLRILCDLVINHCSDQHKWFQESRSSKDNPKRDWFIWRPAKYDADGKRHPPNNWRSCFSESAWEWDEKTQEYYLHLFVVGQPDFNWTNEECRKAIIDSAIKYWLEKGVDGFRIDTASMYSKPMDFPDAPVIDKDVEHQPAFHLFCDGPQLEDYLREIGKVFAQYDSMTVGEFPNATFERSVRATSASDPQMSMNFHFSLCDFGRDVENDLYRLLPAEKRRLSQFKEIIRAHQTHVEGTDSWPSFFLENHDIARAISRYANDAPEHRVASGKMLATLAASQSGTLFLYQGQEIGTVNFPKDWDIEDYQDIGSINYWKMLKAKGASQQEFDTAKLNLSALARDHARTPVQWSAEQHAGFTTNAKGPWMKVNDTYKDINVASQDKDAGSVLNYYRKAMQLRTKHIDVLGHGLFRIHDPKSDETLVYAKLSDEQAKGKIAVVALNFTTKEVAFTLPAEAKGKNLDLALGTHGDAHDEGKLRPLEGRIYLSA